MKPGANKSTCCKRGHPYHVNVKGVNICRVCRAEQQRARRKIRKIMKVYINDHL